MAAPEKIRTVDLFCGCGGLALGFELHKGTLEYETVLGADIDDAALRVFNHNIGPANLSIPTGRHCDLSWFEHPTEFLLYYLAHFALWRPDRELHAALKSAGLNRFLAGVRALDDAFSARAEELAASAPYRAQWACVDPKAVSLALYRGVLGRLGIRSLKTLVMAKDALPWAAECDYFEVTPKSAGGPVHETLRQSAQYLWDAQVERLIESAGSRGRGQHGPVAQRMMTVARFLLSPVGDELKNIWVGWRSQRDSLRAAFCLSLGSKLESLYNHGRRVDLVLGGPPCKGWSRIGRAVGVSLRDQGVHAWACKAYGDERNALLHKYVLVLDSLRPSVFLFENVAHFQSSLRTAAGLIHASTVLEEAIASLAKNGVRYHVDSKIVCARNHGVPQDRERFILAGCRAKGPEESWLHNFFEKLPRYQDDVPLLEALQGLASPGVFDPSDRSSCRPDHEVSSYTLVDPAMPSSWQAYIRWIRQVDPRTKANPMKVDGHITRKLRSDDLSLVKYLAPGMRWMDYKLGSMPTLLEIRALLDSIKNYQQDHRSSQLPSRANIDRLTTKMDDSLFLRLLLEALAPPGSKEEGHHLLQNGYLAKGTDNHGDWLERLSPSYPCKTIVAHIGKDTYGYIHPYEPRSLSLRETARVQTFPDYFSLGLAGVVDTYAMIGNAVPPLLANHFAATFHQIHQKQEIFSPEAICAVSKDAPATKRKKLTRGTERLNPGLDL